ncbi:MAG: dihydropteroate synthase [Pseudomonadota bacterium]
MIYPRPLVQMGPARPPGSVTLGGGPHWFTHVELFERDGQPRVVPADSLPEDVLSRLAEPRAVICGLNMSIPRIMGILNVTPDSFSDGGVHLDPTTARDAAIGMIEHGADLIDVGGESTRPGAETVPVPAEIDRVQPAIAGLRAASHVPISIDTRKSAVAEAAVAAGAALVNDVSGFTHDPELAAFCAAREVPVCVMHAHGDPAVMQQNPSYEDVLLDVYDFLSARIDALTEAGIPRARIIVDPGIGFGKTIEHNLRLLRNIALFHALGCPILLGVSRKRFIGHIGHAPQAVARAPGSIAVGLAALAQGVHILRVHDVAETAQALRLWQAVTGQT